MMNKTNPFSAFYYMKNNRGRVIICIFMMFLATLTFLAGNYIQSVFFTFEKEFEYSDKLVMVNIQSTDEEYMDYTTFLQRVEVDKQLEYVEMTARGFSGMSHDTVLNLEMGGQTFVFNSRENLEKVFKHLGIEGDFANCKNNSMIISKDFAANKGIKLGDTLDHSFEPGLDDTYTVDALIDDGSYCVFYIKEDNENLGRCYVYSDSMEGKELYDYVNDLAEGLDVKVSEAERDYVIPQFSIFYLLFYILDMLIAIVLAVTVNSVMTGQYIKRTYEFGVYRALGISKKEIRKKVAAEILLLNVIACVVGFVTTMLFTYMINELYYKVHGLHLMYFSMTGLIGFIVCDVLIIVPLVLSKGRRMSRADVTEF